MQRYLIGADGAAELVSEIPPNPEYRWASRLYAAGFLMFVAGVVLAVVLRGGAVRAVDVGRRVARRG